MFRGEWAQAVSTLKAHLAMPQAVWRDERCASMRYIARCLRRLEREDEAAPLAAPRHRGSAAPGASRIWSLPTCFISKGLVRRHFYGKLRARDHLSARAPYICEPFAWGSFPYDLLSIAYFHLSQWESALKTQEKRLRLHGRCAFAGNAHCSGRKFRKKAVFDGFLRFSVAFSAAV